MCYDCPSGKEHGTDFGGCIGVFDSGVGGATVLRALVRELPHERFVFFGDSANAPYGDKSARDVLRLSQGIVSQLVAGGCKAIVIACNTATAAAAEPLRGAWPHVPIVGIEPALKPAVLAYNGRPILVMATTATLQLEKFHDLAAAWGSSAQVFPVACPGLADLIEQGDLSSPAIDRLLRQRVGGYAGAVDAVVLGCTHYPFVKRQIAAVVGDVPFFDGAQGTARQLRRQLEARGLLAPDAQEGAVTFRTSSPDPAVPQTLERLYALTARL